MINTKEQLDSILKMLDSIKEEFGKTVNANRASAYNEYVKNNNPYRVGDIIWNDNDMIRIESIRVYPHFEKYPECAYRGIKLKKDNNPYKSGENTELYQSNIKGSIPRR